MAAASRRKGVVGEREVRGLWQASGHAVRGLEGEGDHLVITPAGITLHSEVKRQERCQVVMWMRQAQADTPGGVPWVVSWRPSRSPWISFLETAELAILLGAAGASDARG